MTATRYCKQPWHPELLRRFNPRGRLLEIGCGAGTDHFELAKTARETFAVDLAQEGVDLTNARLQLAGLPANAQVADAEELPYGDGFFDEVYSFGVIHHTDHPSQIVDEIARVLRPGGRFLVGLYHRHSLFAADKAQRWVRHHRDMPWRHYLATLEAGAEELDRRPMVRLYTRRAARDLFRRTGMFVDVRTSTVHPSVRGKIRKFPGANLFGWYVIVTGTRR